MEAGPRRWSTQKQDGVTTIAVGQAFETSEILHVDITDDNIERDPRQTAHLQGFDEGDYYAAAEPSDLGRRRLGGELLRALRLARLRF